MSSFEERMLTPPVVEKKEAPQEWLDKNREKSFENLSKVFSDIYDDKGDIGIHKSFLDIFNPCLIEDGAPALKPEEIKSLQYVNVISESASNVAGTEINRPILVFSDISEFQNFSKSFQGESGLSSRGMNLPGDMFPDGGLLNKTGLVISTSNKDFIIHEIYHSIDPSIKERKGYDRILEEMFAYYQQTIVQADLKQYSHLADPKEGPWGTLSRVIDETYLERYLSESDKKLSKEEFSKLMKDIVSTIRSIAESKGHIEAQRAIAKSKTIEELSKFKFTN